MWLTLDTGEFESVEVNTKLNAICVELSTTTPPTPKAFLRIEQLANINNVGIYPPYQTFTKERDVHTIPSKKNTTWVEMIDRQN